jgi:cytochrome c biogenesis protein CcdA
MNVFTLILALFLGGESPLVFTPPEWDFDTLDRNSGTATIEIFVENRSETEAHISIISTCDCLWVDPGILRLQAGQSASLRLYFDPSDQGETVQKDLIVRTNLDQLPKALYLVHGQVTGVAPAEDLSRSSAEQSAEQGRGRVESPQVSAEFYASPGCRSCQRLLRTIPRIAKQTGVNLIVREHNILEPQVYATYQKRLQQLGQSERAYPALVIGDTILQGETIIEEQLGELLRGQFTPPQSGRTGEAQQGLTVLPILAAGLLDGINPCAFTTLIFLISALAVAGRSRSQVLQIGIFFSAAVFITYLLIGMGFFQAIRLAAGFPTVAIVIRWALIAVLLAFAVLSLYDYFQLRAGKTGRVVLQLPRPIKQRLHRDIKSRTRSAALVTSSLVLGFLVSVFELACTGQVYFPTLVYLYQVRKDAGPFISLLLYNFAFIVPLLIVFALSYWGVSSQRFTRWVQKSMKTVKLLLAALFLGLAVLTVVT